MTFPTWQSASSLPCYGGPLVGDGIALQLHHPFGCALESVLVNGTRAKVKAVITLASIEFDAAYALVLDRPTPFTPLLPPSKFNQYVTAAWARPDGTVRGGYLLRPNLTFDIPPLVQSDRNFASGSAMYADGYCVGVFKAANLLWCPPAPPSAPAAAQILSADFNGDGVVNFTDQLTLAANYGKPGDHAHGDANGDGRVDFSDLLKLGEQYGRKS